MFQVRDALLTVTKALSNGAGNVTTNGIDLGLSAHGDLHADCELLIEAPAMTTAILPDEGTMTYAVVTGDTVSSGVIQSPTTIADAVLVQTGDDSAGAAAASVRFRLPTTVGRYVAVKATKSGTGNASTLSVTASLVF